ncbi:glycoside hydrolase family 18 protein [Aulographum hederae CBS 113979]|uniref:chitinase n=1 Tax=Aulographum hederae CBS 113979 TaxID=1176131 RepID=A0A6G1H5C3_9PEZI|nr:glycoside hydrolase family 18 protein [Aulographum hederae CBS 113979]
MFCLSLFILVSSVLVSATSVSESDYLDQSIEHPTRQSLSLGSTSLEIFGNLFGRDVPSGDFSCGADRPCSNGACCGASGWCGYQPEYCGNGCQSNCNATAECGQYSENAGQKCPLNVCCSEFGFCGTTPDFCGNGCQSNCKQPKPTAKKSNVRKKLVAYYEGWNQQHPCGTMSLDQVPVDDISHLVFAFAYISEDLKITTMDGLSASMFKDITQLKLRNPSLKVMVALGGWTYTDPGKTRTVFSDMVHSDTGRGQFIKNLLGFMTQYGFDGVDFDWEYPGAPDRGGKPTDGPKYTQLLKELRKEIKEQHKNYIVTFTAPTSYWYLRHFDLKGMTRYADWINLMSYDLHGVWDASNPIGDQVLAHTNMTEIDLALDLFWRNNIDPSDIVLGLGFYGRSFKLKDAKCWKPGCAFSSTPADEGPCTKTGGILSYKEIIDIIAETGAKPHYDDKAEVNYFVYGQNNWISFDNEKSFQAKIAYAEKLGLDGLMIWAIDLDDAKHSALAALTGNPVDTVDYTPLAVVRPDTTTGASTDDPSKCRITDCDGHCTPGEVGVGRIKGLDGSNYCGGPGSEHARWICCPAWTSLTADQCHWDNGGGNVKTDCSGKCGVGEIQVAGDSYGWTGKLDTGDYDYHCLRGGKVFCCKSGNLQRYLDICTWTECGGTCPSDKQHVLTTDSGGPKANARCAYDSGGTGGPDAMDSNTPASRRRKLCCPSEQSFKNCGWRSKKVCSEQCGPDQITLDSDPQGEGAGSCDNGREQVFCCDPPAGLDRPFLPVDLDKLFPQEFLPAADAIPQFDLINFGGSTKFGVEDPDQNGIAFFLMAGSDTAVTSMKKRDNPSLVFLECPHDLLNVPLHEMQTARVVCMDRNPKSCFGVQKGGVEGTVVHMPDECGKGSWARAVSLKPSQDQSTPLDMVLNSPNSTVYDFTFDYNIGLVRRDAGRISIRMDYSNVPGYWGHVVNSPGMRKRNLNQLVDRFFSSRTKDWDNKFNELDRVENSGDIMRGSLDQLVFFERKMCTTSKGQYGQGIAVAIEGNTDIVGAYGFSLVATWNAGQEIEVHEAAGFYHPRGTTYATFKVSGTGTLDPKQKLDGNVLTKTFGKLSNGGHSLWHGWANFVPYSEMGVQLATSGGDDGAVSFSGYLESKVQADWGHHTVHFPNHPGGLTDIPEFTASKGNSDMIPMGEMSSESSISVVNTVKVGLRPILTFSRPFTNAVGGDLPDMSVTQRLTGKFVFGNTDGASTEVCLDHVVRLEHVTTMTDGDYVHWGPDYEFSYVHQQHQVGERQCFTEKSTKQRINHRDVQKLTDVASLNSSIVRDTDTSLHTSDTSSTPDERKKKKKRQGQGNDSDRIPDFRPIYEGGTDLLHLLNQEALPGVPEKHKIISCADCQTCGNITIADCCGCIWLPPDEEYLEGMIDPLGAFLDKRSVAHDDLCQNKTCTPEDGLSLNVLDDRQAVGTGPTRLFFAPKKLLFFRPPVLKTQPYPQYPNYWYNPFTTRNFENRLDARYTAGVKRYFHNASADCMNWDVVQRPIPDEIYPWPRISMNGYQFQRGRRYRQVYDTEHVFEGQTISRFLTKWLLSSKALKKRDEAWVTKFMMTVDAKWKNGRDPKAFVNRMIDELGSRDGVSKQERLTIFLSRPNKFKGRLFTGHRPISDATFMSLDAGDAQFTVAKEIGMVFTYMNQNTVWESFCESYNGILNLLEEFDRWYPNAFGTQQNDVSRLAAEWPRYIRSELDMAVTLARASLSMMFDRYKRLGALPYVPRWIRVMTPLVGQISKIKLDRIDFCFALPRTGV